MVDYLLGANGMKASKKTILINKRFLHRKITLDTIWGFLEKKSPQQDPRAFFMQKLSETTIS